MTLSILDTIIDEEFRAVQTGTGDDDDVSVATFDANAFKTALNALALAPFLTSPTGFPQYAEQQNFVSSTNVVTNYFLAGSATGGAFPAAGTATTLYVGANQIFLFATANSDIIVGRVGNGTTADPAGAIAIVIGIEETKDGNGVVTQADMWLVLRAPIVQDGVNLVDSADQLDLTDLVFLGSTFDTTTTVPFENFDGIAPGNNLFNVIFPSDASTAVQLLLTGSTGETLSTVNVSTTGIGAGSQHIDVGYTLRIDTVSGLIKANVDSAPEVNDSGNIDYTARVELVAADFEVTQLNPGATPERVTIKVSAFNAAGTAQEGAYLTNAIAADGVAVTIDAADVVVLNGAGQPATGVTITQDGASVIITGLDDGTNSSKTDGYQVFFTTDGVRFDRFLITNVDGDGTTLDVGNIHVTAVQGGTDTEFAEIGSQLIYQDDGPFIDGSGGSALISVSDETLDAPTPGDFELLFTVPDFGADGPAATGAFTYDIGTPGGGTDSGLIDTATGNTVFLFLVDNPLADPNNPDFDPAASPHVVVGREGDDATDAATGEQVFVISAVGAVVTLEQNRAVFHALDDADQTVSFSTDSLVTIIGTATDGDGDTHSATVPIGLSFTITDAVPEIDPSDDPAQPNDLEVANTVGATDSSFFILDPGNDLFESLEIVGPADSTGDFQWAFFDSGDGIANNEIRGTFKGSPLYDLVVNPDGTYEFEMTGTLPSTELNLNTAEIKAGAPDTNSIQVGAIENDQFVLISGDSDHDAGNINESNAFVGVDNGNLDVGESLTFSLRNPDTTVPIDPNGNLVPFQGISIGTKSAQASQYHFVANLTGGGTFEGNTGEGGVPAVGKNGTIFIDPPGDVFIDSITITKLTGPATKIGLGDIAILVPPNDVVLDFDLALSDGDLDSIQTSFSVSIDGNGDGLITTPITPSLASVTSETEFAELSIAPFDSSATFRPEFHSNDLFLM